MSNSKQRINCDPDYQQHIRKIQQIRRHRGKQLQEVQKYNNISQKLLKNRIQARNFRDKQLQIRRSYSDTKTRENISRMSSKLSKKTLSQVSLSDRPLQRVQTMKEYFVNETNKKLNEAIKSKEVDVKDYKKKIALQVSEYVKLRQHMQRFKTSEDYKEKTHIMKNSQQTQKFYEGTMGDPLKEKVKFYTVEN